MGEVVNLRQARKARARAGAEATATANRAAHGRPRAERDATEAETARRDRTLDGARREEPHSPSHPAEGPDPVGERP